jgi:hypothetical protein
VPTWLELVSLLDLGNKTGAAVNSALMAGTEDEVDHWSSTTNARCGQPMAVRFGGFPYDVGCTAASTTLMVKCVSGDAATPSFTGDNDTITDEVSGLVWARADEASVTWLEALSACEASTVGGHSDWRLPSYKELATLVDHSRSAAPLAAPTLALADDTYWSSTPHARSSGIWVFFFHTGEPDTGDARFPAAVRCVRGGQ